MGVETTTCRELMAVDYDGTVAAEGGTIVEPVRSGIKALWSSGVVTTAITARPFQRFLTVCGGEENIDNIVSAHMPMASDRGGRVIGTDRGSNLQYHPLDSGELDAIVDIENNHGNIDFVGFFSELVDGTSYIWTPDEARADEMTVRFGHDAAVLASGKVALHQALREANPCLVTIRFKTNDEANLCVLPTGLNVAWERRTGVVVSDGISKFSALQVLSDIAGVDLGSTRYAGNDLGDLPVLQRTELKERIFVGANQIDGMAEPVTRLASPEALGEHFIQLAQMGASTA